MLIVNDVEPILVFIIVTFPIK